jgi:antitoxin Phd
VNWKLADAKNQFSELVNRALSEGPQRVQRRNDSVIVLSEADYERLRGEQPNLRDYLLNGPDLSDLDMSRDQSLMREIDV